MCGIIGQLAFGELDEAKEKTRQESMIFLGSELLQLTQERGKDATGVSLLFEDGNYIGLKMGIQPIEFIARFGKNEKEYGGFVKAWRRTKKRVNVFLGHCRKTSRGSAYNNDNNHPIRVGEIIGIHNGTLENDDKIFNNLGCSRNGQVDSEAIFRLLHHFTKNGTEPFTTEMISEVVQRLDGTFAVLGMSGNNPYQVCAFRDRKPIDMALIRPLKLVVIASEKKFIETALFRYNKYGNLYMPDAKFPVLRKSDIDYKIMQDDSGLVFDLTTKVTAKTDIDDLYNCDKTPRAILAGYSKTSGTDTYKNKIINTASKTQTDDAKATVTGSEENKTAGFVPASKNRSKESAGKVFSRKANKFVAGLDEKEIEESKKTGSVELDVDNGKTEVLSKDNGEGPFALDHDDQTTPRTLADDVAIKELPAPKTEKTDTVEVEVTENDGSTNTIEVDVTVDADAVEKAEEMMNGEPMFENADEVIEALEMKDKKTLLSISTTALANRIKKFVMKSGFAKGYAARKEEEDDGHNADDSRKNNSASENIRNLKGIVHMCENILKFSGVGLRDAVIERAVMAEIEDGTDMTGDVLDRVFKPGDDRNSEMIPIIKKIVANRK